jgi:hypothetical protein
VSSPAVPWQWLLTVEILRLHALRSDLQSLPCRTLWNKSNSHCAHAELYEISQTHIAIDEQSISKSWCRAPSGAHEQIFITLWQLQWLSLTISKGPNWVGVFSLPLHPRTETDQVSETSCFYSPNIGRWKKSNTPVTLCAIIHHRQNPIKSS